MDIAAIIFWAVLLIAWLLTAAVWVLLIIKIKRLEKLKYIKYKSKKRKE